MPNGKGQIDCCYCVHFQSEFEGSDAMYEKGFCGFHKSEIPATLPDWKHRICTNIEPNKFFEWHLRQISLTERFGWFGQNLEANVLYEFPYNCPAEVKKLKDL